MEPHDIARMVWSDSPAVSPDGTTIAYVVRSVDGDANLYKSRIWLATADGSAAPRPLTSGLNRESDPCWSPDGSMLAYTAKLPKGETGADDDEESIQLLPFGPGQPAVLVRGPEGFEDLAFSPDGRWLAYVTRTRGDGYKAKSDKDRPPRKIESLMATLNGEGFIVDRPSNVYVVPLNGSQDPINLTPGPLPTSSPSWYPTSDRLAVAVDAIDVDMALVIDVVTLAGDDRTTITDRGSYVHPSVSPDGSQIAVIGFENPLCYPDNPHVGLIDGTGTATPRWITTAVDRTWEPLPGDRAPVWLDESTALAAIEDHGNTHVYQVSTTDDPKLVIGGERMVTAWDHQAGTIALTMTTPEQPPELYSVIDGVERRLSDHSDAFVARVEPRPAERFTARSGSGDAAVDVDAWIYTPHDFDPSERYPMLINVHGGPFTQYGNTFFDEVQLQCKAGFVVVLSNPRGGSGCANDWGQSILGPKHPFTPGTGWGSVDFDDVMAVTDAAIEQFDFIDPERLGMIGGSYGGYMTTWTVTHTDRFAAACSERAANNLLTLDYGSDVAGFFRSELGPTWIDDTAEYLRMSPISYVEQLNTPLLIIHSEDDLRCPIEQANQLFVACKLLGKEDVEFYRFPGETHELSRSGSPTHRRQRAEIIIEFFTRHLLPETASDTDA